MSRADLLFRKIINFKQIMIHFFLNRCQVGKYVNFFLELLFSYYYSSSKNSILLNYRFF